MVYVGSIYEFRFRPRFQNRKQLIISCLRFFFIRFCQQIVSIFPQVGFQPVIRSVF